MLKRLLRVPVCNRARLTFGSRMAGAALAAQPLGLIQHELYTQRWSSSTSAGVGGGAPLHSLTREQLKTDVHRLCYDLIHSGRVVIFLTGTPEQPRCRFTRALCGLLEQIKLKYQFVDIMESDELCEGLKDYSGWPTYPQVYIDNELIGGYDVVKELVLNGSFTKMLSEKGLL